MRRDGHHGSSVSHSVPVPRCAEPVAASSKIMLLDLATEIAGAAGSALADHGPATARFPRSRPTPATCLTQLQPPEDSSPLKIGRVSGCAEGDLASPRSTTGHNRQHCGWAALGEAQTCGPMRYAHAWVTISGTKVLPPCSDLRAPRRLHVTSRQVSGRSQHGALINITRARSTSTPRPPPGAVSVTVELS